MPYRFLFLVLLLLAAPAALAQPGGCPRPARTPLAFLDVNGVRAGLFNRGQLFFSGGDPHYEVPKGSGINAHFAAGIWIGGLVDGELRTAAATYAQGGEDYEFFPGPLDADGNPPIDCAPYDRIWVVSRTDLQRYEDLGVTTNDLRDWPAEAGAPFFDRDGDGVYSLTAGDRPQIRGEQTAWWVMNDVAGPHLTTLSPPLGLEVRVTAFASASPAPALYYTTLYRYEITYRGGAPLEEAYFSLWNDPDLGNYLDDYVGSAPELDLGFIYNADNDDETSSGYGLNPPAFGFRFLETPDDLGLTVARYYNSSTDPRTSNPDTDRDYYFYMQGLWRDGSAMTVGGDGTSTMGEPTTVVYPNSGTWEAPKPEYWSEACSQPGCTAFIPPDDRRLVVSTGPFTLEPGETEVVTLALVWARGSDNFASIQAMKAASEYVARAYALGRLDPVAPEPPDPPEGPESFALAEHAHPNPVAGGAVVRYALPVAAEIRLALYDALGREVAVLADGIQTEGLHEASVEAGDLPPGVYVYRLYAGPWGHAEGRLTVAR